MTWCIQVSAEVWCRNGKCTKRQFTGIVSGTSCHLAPYITWVATTRSEAFQIVLSRRFIHRAVMGHNLVQHRIHIVRHVTCVTAAKQMQTRNAWQSPAWLARSCAVGAIWWIWLNIRQLVSSQDFQIPVEKMVAMIVQPKIQQHKKSAKVVISSSVYCSVYCPCTNSRCRNEWSQSAAWQSGYHYLGYSNRSTWVAAIGLGHHCSDWANVVAR